MMMMVMMNQLISLQVTEGHLKMTTTDHILWLTWIIILLQTCIPGTPYIELAGKN